MAIKMAAFRGNGRGTSAYKQYSLMSTGGTAHDINGADHVPDRLRFESRSLRSSRVLGNGGRAGRRGSDAAAVG